MKKQIFFLAWVLVLTLLVGCNPFALTNRSVTKGQEDPTIDPVVVDGGEETSSDDSSEELPDTPTPPPTFTPVPPAPTAVPTEEPTPEGDGVAPLLTPAGPVDPLAGLIYRDSSAIWRIETGGQAVKISDLNGGTVSPDGKQLLSERDDDLWLVDLESGAERNLTNKPDGFEFGGRWGPAGSGLIAFGSKDETEQGPSAGHLSIVTIDGSDVQVLEPERSSNASPAFSPDGRTIAYDLGGSAWLYHVDSGRSEELDLAFYGLGNPEGIKIGSPAWSPDGRMLAWMIGGGFGPGGDWRVGVALVDLAAETFQLLHPYVVLGGSGGWLPAPVWSSDGQWLAVTTMGERHRVDLWAVNVASQEEHDLGWAHSPVWSPDGRSLIFSQLPCEDVPCYEETQIVQVKVGEWEPQVTDVPEASNPLAWVSSIQASSGAGSALACPAETGPEALACSIQEALLARDIPGLSSLMADPLAMGYWASEWVSRTAAEAAVELDRYRLPADTSSLTFTTDRAQFPPLMGISPDGMFGPDVNVAMVIYSEGWGQDGQGASLLFVIEEADGTYVWNGILEVPSASNPPEAQPSAENTWQASLTSAEWVAKAMAIFPGSGGVYYRELVVSKLDNSVSWTLVQEEELWAMGYSLPIPLHFSQDGLFYFSHRVTPDGCGLFPDGSNLQQVDLETGQVSEIAGRAGAGQALSPDDATLALVRRTPETTSLVLHNLLSGQEREVTLAEGDVLQAGRVVWSPDGSNLVLTLAHEPCSANWTHSIVQVDIASLSLTTLVEKDERHFWSTEWTEDKIRLEDVQGNRWWLALESGQIDSD